MARSDAIDTGPGDAGGRAAGFGAVLKGHRLAAGLTHAALAERAGLGARTISDLERGVNAAPREETLARLADALRLAPAQRAALEAAARRQRLPAPGGARPSNLPLQPTGFVGRARELVEVARLLRTSRLVTLTGAGGCGKTRLAIRVAGDLAQAYPDGVYLVPLESLVDASQVLPATAGRLGITQPPGTGGVLRPALPDVPGPAGVGDRTLPERLTGYIDDRRLLLVLDNFEQVLGAAPLLADLLAGCPRLSVLVTSRVPLHLRGEQEFPVPPLALPDATGRLPPPERLGAYDAIALFVQRARAARADFALTDGNAAAVAEVCRRLDGLPLAIELAAAWTKVLPPDAVNAQLGAHRLALATGDARDVPARQRTLRSAIAWSYDLLSADERALFRRLAVFAGGFTLDAARAVVGGPPAAGGDRRRRDDPGRGHASGASGVLEGLAALVDKSLLQPAEALEGEPRFVMLETVRAFALERLDEAPGDAQTLRRRHLAYYVALAEEAGPKLVGAEQVAWSERLAREQDNVRAALEWAVERGEAGLGLRLAGALWWFLLLHPYLGERWDQWATLLARPEGGARQPAHDAPHDEPGRRVSRRVRARALFAAGALAWAWGDPGAARAFVREGLELAQELGDSWGISLALTGLGHLARLERDYTAARRLYEEALAAARSAGDRRMVTFDLFYLGVLRHIQGDDAGARPFLVESLEIGQEVGDRWAIAAALMNLGHVARAAGDVATARARYDASLALYRQVGDRTSTAYVLSHLGMLALDEGDPRAARPWLEESLGLHREVSSRRFVAGALEGVAGVAAAHGQAARALRLAGAAAALRAAIGRPQTATEQARLECWLRPARRELGAAASEAAWAAGRLVPIEHAIAEALRRPPRASPAERQPPATGEAATATSR
jgi:predicted ATPase